MAINIKELFVTDLDPNSGAWWSKDKVDKINYNFYLLSNGGMPGPQGTIGVDGGFGPIGAQGATGYQGQQGYQGPQGAGSLNDWVLFPETNGFPGYLFPRKNPIADTQSAPVSLRIGYLDADTEYLIGADPQEPVQIVKTPDSSWVNYRVEFDNNISGYNFSFKGAINLDPRFEISPDITSADFKIVHTAQTIIFRTGLTLGSLVDAIKITDSQITINTGGSTGPAFNLSNISGKFTKSEDQFRYTPGAAANKVLVSTNIQGDLEWKNIKDVFGTFPIGSIISIRPSEFIPAHFWLDDSISVTAGSPLNNIYGRGKAGTDYEGWYLCNGETWETLQGFNQYLTPNLNNFSYTIDDNGDVQNPVIISEGEPVLIGGYDMRITAIPDANGIYSVGYSTPFPNNDTSPGGSTISMDTGGAYYTSRMIHIVYLEDPNLKWSNTGVYIPPAATTTITLTLPLASSTLCSEPVTTYYSWTGPDEVTWNTFTPLSSYSLFNFGTTNFAPVGWYINVDGYPIYWDGTSFIQRGTTCVSAPPPNYTPNLRYSALIDDLNGPISAMGGTLIYLDMSNPTGLVTSLDQATGLVWSDDQLVYPVGDPAPSGWYRDINTGVRRYWNGNSFTANSVSFTEDYVHFVYGPSLEGFPEYGYANVNTNPSSGNYQNSQCAVQSPTDRQSQITYVAGNGPLLINAPSGNSMTVSVAGYDSALYVSIGWLPPLMDIDGTVLATPPLINIKDQFKPGSTTLKYKFAYMDFYSGNPGEPGEYYGIISATGIGATGKISATYGC